MPRRGLEYTTGGAVPTVETVLGTIDAAALGFTLSHEHVLVAMGADNHNYPWLFDWQRTRANAVRELREAKAGGVDTIIDLTTPDLGRDVEFVRDVASAAEINIVVATGIWRDVPRSFWERSIDRIADIFVREIEVGIGETAIKAGVIKVANDAEGVTPEGERVLRGAARALKRTGCPISTHHWGAGRGRTPTGGDLPRRGHTDGSDLHRTQRRHDVRRLPGVTARGWSLLVHGPLPRRGGQTRLAPAGRHREGANRSRLGPPPDAGSRLRARACVGAPSR